VRPTLFPPLGLVRQLVELTLADRLEQGHRVDGLSAELAALPDSYDALLAFAERLADLPLREDWPYVEPTALQDLRGAWAPDRPSAPRPYDATDVKSRVHTSFLARVAGCMLGKPFEFDPTMAELRGVLEPIGEWPLSDYVSEAVNAGLRSPQPQWPELVRERMDHVVPDDDVNYTILAMLLLEEHGPDWTQEHLRELWLHQLPVRATFGPERVQLLAAGLRSFAADTSQGWAEVLNPCDEHCGALIRVDAYGWAHPGDPEQAAWMAARDASVTHRRTGVYAASWVAAAIAECLVSDPQDRLAPLERAAAFVPAASRFADVLRESLDLVRQAPDWVSAHEAVHGRFGAWSHCRVNQEVGTLMVTMRFARDVGHGLGVQVCQGNDTDSFGATAGSLLGALLGPTALDVGHWIDPMRDDLRTALAMFHERSLARLAVRMSELPARFGGASAKLLR
jgi:ADP-ribosylglycohydrolase